MPRYLVEGEARVGAEVPQAELGQVVERNLMASVTWICSFIADRRTYALYEGPHPEAVRRAAGTSGLEVTRVSEVQLLDPYAYQCQTVTVPRDDQLPTEAGPDREEPARPLFMDVHSLGSVAAGDVAEAHKKDLETQGQYGVSYKKYWINEEAGKIFCLADGPDAETVSRVHAEAHGLVADEIYEVAEHT